MNSFTQEKKELDSLWSETIKARDKRCMICGGPAEDAHHSIVRRMSNKTRWHLLNGFAVCRKCHILIHCGKLKNKVMDAIGKIATKEQQAAIKLQGHEIWSIHKGWLDHQRDYLCRILNQLKSNTILTTASNAVEPGNAQSME